MNAMAKVFKSHLRTSAKYLQITPRDLCVGNRALELPKSLLSVSRRGRKRTWGSEGFAALKMFLTSPCRKGSAEKFVSGKAANKAARRKDRCVQQ